MTSTRTRIVLDGVIAQLKSAFTPPAASAPRLAVEDYPDNPDTYRLTHPLGALLLRQIGDEFSPPQDSGLRNGSITGQRGRPQERLLVLRITLMFRQLNGSDGVTTVLDEVKDALWGFSPDGSRGAIHFVASGFVGVDAGIWEHALDIAVPMWERGAST